MHVQSVRVIGELLVDFVATDPEVPLADCPVFRPQVGGSCGNVARFLHALGTPTTFLSAVGRDGLGDFLTAHLRAIGVPLDDVRTIAGSPTTIVVVNKTSGTPQFVVHLGAHADIDRSHVPTDWLATAALLHTNGFSLARAPPRDTILALVDEAAERNVPISFDPNWRAAVWPDRPAAAAAIRATPAKPTYMKPSLDDARELFGNGTPDELADRYRAWGARTVVLTMGGEGALVVADDGRRLIPARGRLKCATGAGDAFWSLFLHAALRGDDPVRAADEAAERIVEFLESQTLA